jgi:predicted ABC-type sugar transport system permease subunit
MNFLIYNLIANFSVIALEGIYRKGVFPNFLASLPYIWLLVIITQWGLFSTFKLAPNYFLAAATFSLINLVLRIGMNNFILHEPFTIKTGIALGLLLISCILLK